jgi:hypothetical protein
MKRRLPDDEAASALPPQKRARPIARLEEGDATESDLWGVVAARLTPASRFSLSLTCRLLYKLLPPPRAGAVLGLAACARDVDQSPALFLWLSRTFKCQIPYALIKPLFALRMWRLSMSDVLELGQLYTHVPFIDELAWKTLLREELPSDWPAITSWLLKGPCGLDSNARFNIITNILDKPVWTPLRDLLPALFASGEFELHEYVDLVNRCVRAGDSPHACRFLAHTVLPALTTHLYCMNPDTPLQWEDVSEVIDLLIALKTARYCEWCATTVEREVLPALAFLRERLLAGAYAAMREGPQSDDWMLALGTITRN